MTKHYSEIAQKLIANMENKGYICLQGKYWNDMWEIISKHKKITPPLILAGWWESNDAQKKERFLQHITEADNLGLIPQIQEYLANVPLDAYYKGC